MNFNPAGFKPDKNYNEKFVNFTPPFFTKCHASILTGHNWTKDDYFACFYEKFKFLTICLPNIA